MTSVIEVKDKWHLSVPDEMQVPAECLASARQGLAADLRVIFTQISNTSMYVCTVAYVLCIMAFVCVQFQKVTILVGM